MIKFLVLNLLVFAGLVLAFLFVVYECRFDCERIF
jgi:hypothetical protein